MTISIDRKPSSTTPATGLKLLPGILDKSSRMEPLDGSHRDIELASIILHGLASGGDQPKIVSHDELILQLNACIAHIDHLINDQLNLIIKHKKLQKLESSWRGLWYVTSQADSHRSIKIRFLDISWQEICKDLEKSIDIEHSQLFHKIYSEEYGTAGGEPYGAIIGDYEISHKRSANHRYDDMAALAGISQIAAAAFSPFIAGASSEFFGLDDFATLGMPLNLQAIFSQQEYIPWRSLREKSDSRFVGLALPKIMLRPAYRRTPGNYKGIFYYDKSDHSRASTELWGNACYAFAGILIREFANVGWFGHIRGVPRDLMGGGLVTDFSSRSDDETSSLTTKPIVDVIITDTQERELSDLGFIPLCHCYDTPFAAFYSNQSIQLLNQSLSSVDSTNAKLSAMMQHVLCASRIAHYLKVMIRDKIGSFITPDECERFLMEWLFRYTTGRSDLEWEEQARYPLRQAKVTVNEHPDKPGQYYCVIHLVPQYQVDNMVSELELVTELVQKS